MNVLAPHKGRTKSSSRKRPWTNVSICSCKGKQSANGVNMVSKLITLVWRTHYDTTMFKVMVKDLRQHYFSELISALSSPYLNLYKLYTCESVFQTSWCDVWCVFNSSLSNGCISDFFFFLKTASVNPLGMETGLDPSLQPKLQADLHKGFTALRLPCWRSLMTFKWLLTMACAQFSYFWALV